MPNQRVFSDPFTDGWVGDAELHGDSVFVDTIVEQVDCGFADTYAVPDMAVFDAHRFPIV